MTDPISARLRSSLFKSPRTAEAADHIDAQNAKIKALVEASEWLELKIKDNEND